TRRGWRPKHVARPTGTATLSMPSPSAESGPGDLTAGRLPIRSGQTLEKEITSVIASSVKENDRAKVELWLGLGDGGLPTLQQVADAAGLTRQRIQQIVER